MTRILRDEDVEKIEQNLILLKSRYTKLVFKIFNIQNVFKNEKSKEYLIHGVVRRLDVIERCVENIYSIFPLRREKLLSRDELKDVDINLHAFFINIFGLLDNIAWVVVYEKNKSVTIDKRTVGLYKKETQECLDDDFKKYLNSDIMKKWHDEYLRNYRNALSHRIPLYVHPKKLTQKQKEQEEVIGEKIVEAMKNQDTDEMDTLQREMDGIGEPSPSFVHSLSETGNKFVILHAQVITDFGTVEEIIKKFCESFEVVNPTKNFSTSI
ncbi:MAG: hypothetical protein KJ887_03525 [Candidatus Omnitrophica bacterium]|nr:hypothetical protein [Candidatus Omnitrophota bacterium]MBU1047093.1 hypothetical protein [Candidatus Omnitrophota bacterium]MBU1631545.1 hypothetical protein [Candidatus Omnitrophota bacterium]MBU1767719.1 hypothetical protein [Candidatus Omnitrophota bacterium]MBU1888759.1 hypothetical protein [Candidatus Omnitrophota bacterium]